MVGGVLHNIQLGLLNTRLKSSNLALGAARAGAEDNARDALATIAQMLVRVADERLKGIPEAEPVRRDLLNDALKRLEPLQRRNPTNPEIRHEMGRAHLGIGAIHVALGEFSRAIAQGQAAQAILEPLVNEQPGDRRFAISFAESQLSLANLLAPADGKKHFLRAVEILEPLAETDPAARWKLASSYYAIAFAKGGFGLAPAESYCARAISLLESLARDDPSTYNHDLARAVYNLALRDANQGKPDAAERGYRRCLQIWEESSSGAWSDSDQEGIAACQEALGTMLQARGQANAKSEAGSLLRQAVDSRAKLARRHPRLLVHRQGLASAWSNLGSYYWRDQRYQEAEPPYAEAVRLSEENVRDFSEERGQKVLLAHNYQNLADCWGKLKRVREAREGFEKALRVIDPMVVNSPPEFGALQCVGVVCLNFGNLLRSVSGPAAALPVDERCVRASEEAHRLAPDHAEMRRFLKGARGNLRATYEQLNRYDDALSQIDATLPLCDAKERAGHRLLRALTQVRAGRHQQAVAEARSLESEPGLDNETFYNLACVYSLAAGAVRVDPKLDPGRSTELARECAAAAIRLIEQSRRDGKFPKKDLLDLLGKDTDLEPIRNTSEFKALVERINK
jgi:tetratricopeptide (TPR) repeat protein